MLQYNIPQFVDSEDKIIGPLTIRQFASLAIGVVILGFGWVLTPNVVVFAILAVPVLGATVAFSFVKINGQTFATFITNIITFILKPTLFLWSRDPQTATTIIKTTVKKRTFGKKDTAPEFSQARVDEIAWTLDTYGQKTVLTQGDE